MTSSPGLIVWSVPCGNAQPLDIRCSLSHLSSFVSTAGCFDTAVSEGLGQRWAQVFERTVPWGLGSVPALPGTAGTPRRTQSLCSELAGAMPLGTPAASHGQIPALSVPFRFRRRVCWAVHASNAWPRGLPWDRLTPCSCSFHVYGWHLTSAEIEAGRALESHREQCRQDSRLPKYHPHSPHVLVLLSLRPERWNQTSFWKLCSDLSPLFPSFPQYPGEARTGLAHCSSALCLPSSLTASLLA